METKFNASFDSLYNFKTPDWSRDAKFGIRSHWGPQSVPMYGDWYARNMYIEGSDQYKYHVRHYGHPSKFGFKDSCALWKTEKFEPDELMALYYKAGARFFIAQATHHDNFFNFTCKDKDVYEFLMCAPQDRRAGVRSFTEEDRIEKVTLLGYGEVPFAYNFGVLTVSLPEELPTQYTNCRKVTLA